MFNLANRLSQFPVVPEGAVGADISCDANGPWLVWVCDSAPAVSVSFFCVTIGDFRACTSAAVPPWTVYLNAGISGFFSDFDGRPFLGQFFGRVLFLLAAAWRGGRRGMSVIGLGKRSRSEDKMSCEKLDFIRNRIEDSEEERKTIRK